MGGGRQVNVCVQMDVSNLCFRNFFPFGYRESFVETLGIDLRKAGPLIDPSIEKELQST